MRIRARGWMVSIVEQVDWLDEGTRRGWGVDESEAWYGVLIGRNVGAVSLRRCD